MFLPNFVADTKIIFGYNCVAPLKLHSTLKKRSFYENFEKSKIATLKVTLIVVGDLPMMLQELNSGKNFALYIYAILTETFKLHLSFVLTGYSIIDV